MKKLFLLAAALVSYTISAQATNHLYIQNYSKHYVEYVVWKSNQANVVGGCSPSLQSSPSGSISKLNFSPNPGITPTEAFYDNNVNKSNTFNPAYPDTPLVDHWSVNGSYPASPLPIPAVINTAAPQWSGIKFGIQDQMGTNIGGWYSLGQACGGALTSDLSANPNAVVNAKWFTLGGSTWIVIE